MKCTKPIRAWVAGKTAAQQDLYVFKRPTHTTEEPILLPCGKCLNCSFDRSRDWAVRSYHESITSRQAEFITLTYNDEHLPENNWCDKTEIPKFMKRFRKNIGANCKYLGVQEYGSKNGRAHYHIILFGYQFPDKKFWDISPSGHPTYRSELLESLWLDKKRQSKGFSLLGDQVTFETAAYVSRYTIAKRQQLYYDQETGEILREPEKNFMSKGIGLDWYKKHKHMLTKGYIELNNKKYPIPRYYKELLAADMPGKYIGMKAASKQIARDRSELLLSPANQRSRQIIQEQKSKLLKRNI